MSGQVVVVGGLGLEETVHLRRIVVDGSVDVAERASVAVGGAAAWSSAAAAATGALSRCIATVGSDRAGTLCRQHLARADVDVTGVLPLNGPTARLIRSTTVEGHCPERPAAPPEHRFSKGEPSLLVLPGAGWAVPAAATVRALDRCEPGDVLLVEWSALAVAEQLICTAYELDMQIVALLAPYPIPPHQLDLRLVDVAVVDRQGAMLLAETGELPPSLCVTLPGHGLSWDGQTYVAPSVDHRTADRIISDERGHAVLAGTIAGRLACGDDRPQAAQAALAAVGELVAAPDDPGRTDADSAASDPGGAPWQTLRPWTHLRLDVEELG
ncbi:hypothetical protein [Austwickia chelonae]|uniref:hypothetical protein n=1 Tax=Austwickia chelonae TaxID=100225 RepID=UPI000E266780|nr:hypothetical protein [Austwickia chelonae]